MISSASIVEAPVDLEVAPEKTKLVSGDPLKYNQKKYLPSSENSIESENKICST